MESGIKKERLHPYASHYEYASPPEEAEGIFAGRQTSPWIRVSHPSDWYRGPWRMDRTQGDHRFRRQPRGLLDPAGISGCPSCVGMGEWAAWVSEHPDTLGAAAISAASFFMIKGSKTKRALIAGAVGVGCWFAINRLVYGR